mmetsp:Transcript_24815/g.59922  ORF Transcript_24815/g.59922 Transcript_24815/m.59922 type:complete len:83 (-) Transcript_24815:117-365(-)
MEQRREIVPFAQPHVLTGVLVLAILPHNLFQFFEPTDCMYCVCFPLPAAVLSFVLTVQRVRRPGAPSLCTLSLWSIVPALLE